MLRRLREEQAMKLRTAGAALLAATVVASSGCYHYTTDVPGVLDLRSDGASAQENAAAIENKEGDEVSRDGFMGFLNGAGVQAEGSKFTVEDRHLFLGIVIPGLFVIMNDSASEELDAAMGEGGAIRKVRIGHTEDMMSILLSIGTRIVAGIVPVVNAIASPVVNITNPFWFTFTASGERIQGSGGKGAMAPPPPPADAPPPPPPPPPPPAEGDAPPATDAAPEEGTTEEGGK
jgi:hypothetical protein